ncbi:hypothetical protein scyTo_0023299 [Scyliorhinus torazame]|uniref:Uncharacterized protein n=1 Tax=Scyliorhinus torazame TaxID=75743 RepID=A0A401Q871_SCYTO|nr:hypothetical protein [Scyliorhinus torazame]
MLSQLLSIHVHSVNVMVLNAWIAESLWHMALTDCTFLLLCNGNNVTCKGNVSKLNSKIMKSSEMVSARCPLRQSEPTGHKDKP